MWEYTVNISHYFTAPGGIYGVRLDSYLLLYMFIYYAARPHLQCLAEGGIQLKY